MTVEQLINRLEIMPKDAQVIIENDDIYLNGDYTVDFVDNCRGGIVRVGSNYVNMVGEEKD